MPNQEIPSTWNRILRTSARGVAVVSAVFTLVVLTLLVVDSWRIRTTDPINDPELQKLRLEFKQKPEDQIVVQKIRLLDLQARRVLFTSQKSYATGALLLLTGAVVLLVALRVIALADARLPFPGPYPPGDRSLQSARWSRRLVGAFAVIMLLTSLILIVFSRPTPAPDAAQPVAATAPAQPKPPVRPAPAKGQFPSIEELRRNWPAFRGYDGNGIAFSTNAPVDWDGASGKNIAWKTAIPRPGFSSPVIWRDRVFVTGGDATNREVCCLALQDGRMLWQKTVGGYSGSPRDLPENKIKYTGYAAPTPATDGARVFAVFATGDAAAFDMDGKPVWGKNLGVPDNHYGHSSSLLVYQDLLIVQFDDNVSPRVMALDTATGEEIWRTPREVISWASPICVNTGSRMELILTCNKSVDSYDPASGTRLWTCKCLGGEVGPSAAYAGGMVFSANEDPTSWAAGIQVPAEAAGEEIKSAWQLEGDLPDVASPAATDKYAIFLTSGGMIACRDAKTGAIKWRQEFDNGFYSSPILAGNRVYAVDKSGITRIFTLGDQYAKAGEPKLGEPCCTTPAFLDGKILIRGDTNLFCIVEKK